MRRVQLSFAIILIWVGLLGASSCALYEEFEPLGTRPAEGDLRSDAGPDAEAGSGMDADSTTDAGSDGYSDVEEPGGVVVSAESVRLELFETQQLSAILQGSDGEEIRGAEFTWQSDDESTATVDEAGLLEGLALGATTLAVTSGEFSATVDLLVYTRIERVDVEPSLLRLNMGEGAYLSARVYDEDDALLSGYDIGWTSTKPAIVSVSSAGLIEGLREGSATIRVESGGKQAEAQITVTAPVKTVQITP